jgi:hypothetical protein
MIRSQTRLTGDDSQVIFYEGGCLIREGWIRPRPYEKVYAHDERAEEMEWKDVNGVEI